MTRLELLQKLNTLLAADLPEYADDAQAFAADEQSQWRLFRSLCNLRPPLPASDEFLAPQDELLLGEAQRKGIVDADELAYQDGVALWQGDITRLKAGAIVNAANSALLGCFHPCHGCIDNAIHTYAGVQLRLECDRLMREQGHPEPVGRAKLTSAYDLPCDYVLHTVGPMVFGGLTPEHERQLADCYRSCLDLAAERGISTLAFCCISTGEFHFPRERAAAIAVDTVRDFLRSHGDMRVIFNVFKDADRELYERLL